MFEGVDVDEKSIEIYAFLVCQGDEEMGAEVYESMKGAFAAPAFEKLEL